MTSRLLFFLPLVAFALFAGISTWFIFVMQSDSQRAPNIIPAANLNQPVPEFDLPPLLDDVPGMATGDFKGEVVLVNVFASWCIPCRAEHPLINRLSQEGVLPVYGLNWKDKKSDATAWLAELGNPYDRIGHDLSGRVGIDWGVYGVPESYLIDKQGRIRYKHVGPIFADTLNKTILPKIRELQAE